MQDESVRCDADLRVMGDIDPDEVTALLGCAPSWAYRTGEVWWNESRTRSGRHGRGCWGLRSTTFCRGAGLEEHLRALLDHVTSDSSVWRQLNARFVVDVYARVRLTEGTGAMSLTPDIARRLAERGIEIGLDVISPEDELSSDTTDDWWANG